MSVLLRHSIPLTCPVAFYITAVLVQTKQAAAVWDGMHAALHACLLSEHHCASHKMLCRKALAQVPVITSLLQQYLKAEWKSTLRTHFSAASLHMNPLLPLDISALTHVRLLASCSANESKANGSSALYQGFEEAARTRFQ